MIQWESVLLGQLPRPSIVLILIMLIELGRLPVCRAIRIGISQQQIDCPDDRVHVIALARVVTGVPTQGSVGVHVWMEDGSHKDNFRCLTRKAIRAPNLHLNHDDKIRGWPLSRFYKLSEIRHPYEAGHRLILSDFVGGLKSTHNEVFTFIYGDWQRCPAHVKGLLYSKSFVSLRLKELVHDVIHCSSRMHQCRKPFDAYMQRTTTTYVPGMRPLSMENPEHRARPC